MAKTVVITVIERNDPVVAVEITKVGADGTETAYDLTGAVVEFVAKSSQSADDSTGFAKYTSSATPPSGYTQKITITDATAGKAEINFVAADIDDPGTFFYHLDVIKDSKRNTALLGDLVITDI